MAIISEHAQSLYNTEEALSIVAVVYNHIQLSILLNLESEAKSTYEKWQNVFLQRIDDLKNQSEDDSLDWVDPDDNEDMNDILEFMASKKEEALSEINFLSNPFILSNVYLVQSYLSFYNSQIPKENFYLSLFEERDIIKAQFDIEDENTIGIKGFPKWNT